VASGNSIDWVKDALGTRFPFIWELRDNGRYGFILPANQIIDTSEEAWNSVEVILRRAKNTLKGNTNL
jgi:hypothetical protein